MMHSKPNVPSFLRSRETHDGVGRLFQQRVQVTSGMISRLGLEAELQGHSGCVNCLEWNKNGDLLASASDDVQVMLWDPHRHKLKKSFASGHQGNIFSVKFMPETNDNSVVTGAADFRIRVHNVMFNETTFVCSCHMNRVKRIATASTCPNLFWSAAEDGTVMQFDIRVPHTCTLGTCVLINLLNHLGPGTEAKCIAISPTQPELLAVGANDPYVRLYDRRMIKPMSIQYPGNVVVRTTWERHFYLSTRAGEGDPDNNIPRDCVQYFVPGHLPPKSTDPNLRLLRGMASTYITFSADGKDLLVNLGGEQIYLFNVYSHQKPVKLEVPEIPKTNICERRVNGFTQHDASCSEGSNIRLPKHVEELKLCANQAFEEKMYSKAVSMYSEAIAMYPKSAILYGNRAAALVKRAWEGDTYAALRDCLSALKIDPKHMKSHFRMARCLLELHRPQEAQKCLSSFLSRHPEHSQSHSLRALSKDVQKALDMLKEHEKRKTEEKKTEDAREGDENSIRGISELEMVWRDEANDYQLRFCGHCNTTTDIKEANFFGSDGLYIVAGSDDGSFFVWERETGNIVKVLRGDDSIVNCLQPHPSICLLATSGIDPVVRLWSPRPEDGESNDRVITDANLAATLNQRRMRADPFEVMLMNMGYRVNAYGNGEGEDGETEESGSNNATINCRAS